MKIVKIAFISILAIIALALIGLFIFLKTFDINKFMPQITSGISNAISREVTIDHGQLDVDLFKGIALNLKTLKIKDDAVFSNTDFLNVENIHVGLDLMSLITKREIQVTDIKIEAPLIRIVRLADGRINAQTMAAKDDNSTTAVQPSSLNPSKSQTSNVQAVALPALTIRSFIVSNAKISFEDKNPQMPIHADINDIQIKVQGFSLTDPFDLSLSANAFSKSGNNIMISARCSLDISKTAVYVKDIQFKSDLSQLDLDKIKSITPMLTKIQVWPQELKGNVSLDIPQLNTTAKGLDGLTFYLALKDGSIKLKELLSPVQRMTMDVQGDLNEIELKRIQAFIGSGELNVTGRIMDVLSSPTYSFEMISKAIKVEELVDESKFPAVFKGNLNGQFTVSGSAFEPEAMMKNLKGEGEFNFTDAKVEKLNILKSILEKLNFIPLLGGLIQSAVLSSIPEKYNTDTTVLTKAQTKIKLQDKVISINDGVVESDLFTINAQGQVGFDMNTSIDVNTYIASDLSSSLVKKVKPLNGLMDDQNRLYIPGKVLGKAPDLGFKPDMDYIKSKVVNSEGVSKATDQLQKVLDKNPGVKNILNSVLGGGASAEATDSTSTETAQEDDTAKKAINKVLSIFN